MNRDPVIITRALLYLIPGCIFIVGLVVLVNPSGQRTIAAQAGTSTALLSHWFPVQRLDAVLDRSQRVREQPIYIHVRYPRRYQTVKVLIDLDNPSGLAWRIGLEQAGTDSFSYFVKDPDASGSATFSLTNARVTDRTLRFMLTIPDSYDGSVRIKGARVTFSDRESL